jgi:hypothetical protein
MPFQRDRHLWARFCRTVEDRIEDARAAEGIDGRREVWQTFDPPLPLHLRPSVERRCCCWCGKPLSSVQIRRGQRTDSLSCSRFYWHSKQRKAS